MKSGKSTFINALFKKDYLKRGAGVVTSIVTRVRCGQSLLAKLYFKSWQEVNMDMEQSLVLFPSSAWQKENRKFDIRHRRDRVELRQALNDLSPDHMITNDSRNANSVLLMSYLKGYEKIKAFVSSENVFLCTAKYTSFSSMDPRAKNSSCSWEIVLSPVGPREATSGE